jgi:RecJ-like exonuclease
MGFETDWTPVPDATVPCRKCGEPGGIEVREWESSCGGYDDYKYRCNNCNSSWWIEGPDA